MNENREQEEGNGVQSPVPNINTSGLCAALKKYAPKAQQNHENNSLNGVFEPGNQFVITGDKIKIAGDDPSCGLYFVPVGGAPIIGGHPAPIKLTRIVENTSNKIIGVIPETDWAFIKVEIRTQYTGSTSVFLKEPRVLTSDFTIEHV
jgi:hypothetical protein